MRILDREEFAPCSYFDLMAHFEAFQLWQSARVNWRGWSFGGNNFVSGTLVDGNESWYKNWKNVRASRKEESLCEINFDSGVVMEMVLVCILNFWDNFEPELTLNYWEQLMLWTLGMILHNGLVPNLTAWFTSKFVLKLCFDHKIFADINKNMK